MHISGGDRLWNLGPPWPRPWPWPWIGSYGILSFIIHRPYRHSLPKSRSNWKNVLWTDGQTYVRTDDRHH